MIKGDKRMLIHPVDQSEFSEFTAKQEVNSVSVFKLMKGKKARSWKEMKWYRGEAIPAIVYFANDQYLPCRFEFNSPKVWEKLAREMIHCTIKTAYAYQYDNLIDIKVMINGRLVETKQAPSIAFDKMSHDEMQQYKGFVNHWCIENIGSSIDDLIIEYHLQVRK